IAKLESQLATLPAFYTSSSQLEIARLQSENDQLVRQAEALARKLQSRHGSAVPISGHDDDQRRSSGPRSVEDLEEENRKLVSDVEHLSNRLVSSEAQTCRLSTELRRLRPYYLHGSPLIAHDVEIVVPPDRVARSGSRAVLLGDAEAELLIQAGKTQSHVRRIQRVPLDQAIKDQAFEIVRGGSTSAGRAGGRGGGGRGGTNVPSHLDYDAREAGGPFDDEPTSRSASPVASIRFERGSGLPALPPSRGASGWSDPTFRAPSAETDERHFDPLVEASDSTATTMTTRPARSLALLPPLPIPPSRPSPCSRSTATDGDEATSSSAEPRSRTADPPYSPHRRTTILALNGLVAAAASSSSTSPRREPPTTLVQHDRSPRPGAISDVDKNRKKRRDRGQVTCDDDEYDDRGRGAEVARVSKRARTSSVPLEPPPLRLGDSFDPVNRDIRKPLRDDDDDEEGRVARSAPAEASMRLSLPKIGLVRPTTTAKTTNLKYPTDSRPSSPTSSSSSFPMLPTPPDLASVRPFEERAMAPSASSGADTTTYLRNGGGGGGGGEGGGAMVEQGIGGDSKGGGGGGGGGGRSWLSGPSGKGFGRTPSALDLLSEAAGALDARGSQSQPPEPTTSTSVPMVVQEPQVNPRSRKPKVDINGEKKARSPYIKWNVEEDKQLLQAVIQCGCAWDSVAKLCPTRAYHQVRQRFLRGLRSGETLPPELMYLQEDVRNSVAQYEAKR
ncbi:hypothetical protein JCM10212_005581, partial [Sporobolomyces blumeae]